MANMSYCRFENTLADLQDCYDVLGEQSLNDIPSESEKEYARKLINLCKNIVADFSDDIDEE